MSAAFIYREYDRQTFALLYRRRKVAWIQRHPLGWWSYTRRVSIGTFDALEIAKKVTEEYLLNQLQESAKL